MKQLLVLTGCAIILSTITGCQNADSGADVNADSGVDVIVEGDGQFPAFLVGTWKADRHGWEFVFQPDGTISSAVIDSGMVRVTPSKKVATVELKQAGKGTYKLGQWTVQYSTNDRELAVEVVVEHFRIVMPSGTLEGSGADWFVGPVSENSQMWEAEWFTFPKHILLGPEPMEFPFDPNDNPIDTLVFRKQQKTN